MLGQRDKVVFPDTTGARWSEDGSYIQWKSLQGPRSPKDYGVTEYHPIRIPIEGELNFHQGYFLAQPEPAAAPTLVWFFDRGQNLGAVLSGICEVYKTFGVNIVCVDPRGFGACAGIPTESSLRADARRVVNYVVKEMAVDPELPAIDPSRVFVAGEGVGAHAALETTAHPAVRDLVRGAIISNAFTNFVDSGHGLQIPLPRYYLDACFPQKLDNKARVEATALPLLFLSSTNNPRNSLALTCGLAKAARDCPHTAAILNGAGELNGMTIAREMPESFRKVISSFFRGEISERPAHYFEASTRVQEVTGYIAEFEPRKEDSAEGDDSAASLPTRVRKHLSKTIEDWKKYLNTKMYAPKPSSHNGVSDSAAPLVAAAARCTCSPLA